MSEGPKQHVILVEGFDDRAFWAGWLLHLGFEDPSNQGRRPVDDLHGDRIDRGRFAFRSPSGSLVVIKPFYGRDKLERSAKDYLREQPTKPIDRLVLNFDSDAEAGAESNALGFVRGILERLGASVDHPLPVEVELEGMRVSSVVWECDDPAGAPGIPSQQCLERLVSASIQAAYPDRGPAVDTWLDAEPVVEGANPRSAKSFGFSYLAKWYADHGANDFFREIWRDERVASELEQRLTASGAWAVAQRLL